jgi:hypothetical protein
MKVVIVLLTICGFNKAFSQTPIAIFDELNQIYQTSDLMISYSTNVVRATADNYQYSYVSHALSNLGRASNANTNILETGDMDVSFSDRGYFTGGKDKIRIRLRKTPKTNSVSVLINDLTWTNKESALSNVTWQKEPFGYFLTAKGSDNRSTVYYTIMIYKVFRIP